MRGAALLALAFLSGCHHADDWKLHTPPGGRYRVSMPADAAEREVRAGDATVKLLLYEVKEGLYSVGYHDLGSALEDPPAGKDADQAALDERKKQLAVLDAERQKRLEAAADGAVAREGGRKFDQKTRPLKAGERQHPGLEIAVEGSDAKVRLRIRLYLVGSRLYQMTSAGGETWVGSDGSTRFLDSFALTEEGGGK